MLQKIFFLINAVFKLSIHQRILKNMMHHVFKNMKQHNYFQH